VPRESDRSVRVEAYPPLPKARPVEAQALNY
jgi:hypothetical protein